MDLGTVQSGRTLPQDSNVQNETAMEDSELLRRLVRLLSKSEEDELYAQDARRRASSNGLNTLQRSKSEGFTASLHMNRSRSALMLAETAPLRISRAPKVDLTETYRDFERSSSGLCSKLNRLQNVLQGTERGSAVSKAAFKMTIHLENVINYMKQHIDILAQADTGPPSEGEYLQHLIHARNLSSALASLAQSVRALARTLIDIRADGLLADADDLEPLENLAQLAELESRSIKDSKVADSLKRMSGIRFRQHSAELSTQLCKACDDVTICLSEVVKSVIPILRERRDREGYKHLLRTGIAVLFSVITAVMLSVSIERGSTMLDLAVSGIWLVSLACGIASGITGTTGLFCSESSTHGVHQPSGKASKWLAQGTELLFLGAAALFSTGLCIFAFSSSQATATRAIITIFTAIHLLGLFTLFIWLVQSHKNENSEGRAHHAWSSMRNLAQFSLRTTGGAQDGIGLKDVEQGLRPRASFKSTAPPIIHVTDTEQDTTAPAPTPSMSRNNVHNKDADPEINPNVSDDESGSEHDLTSISFSHTHTNLVVPSAHRVSSDSSRSLPALPSDVQVARCMCYSPNGMFLCIGNSSPQERCTIFSTDSPAITLGELKLTDVARQIEWSPDGENILLRLSHMIYVWNAMPSASARRPVIIIHQDADNVKWLPNNDSFLSCQKDILTSFDVHGTPTGVFQIPVSSTQDFIVTKDGNRVICLVSNFASARSGKTAISTQKLIVYNLNSKTVEQIAPVGRDALSIVRSTVLPDLILVNFVGSTPPQVWRYRQNTDASERRTSSTFLSFKRAMSFKAPSGRFSGYGIFGSTDDKLILSLGEDGDMFVFASDTGQPLRHINTNASRSSLSDRKSLNGLEPQRRARPLAQCVAWDPDILTFTVCMGFADGSIWQWKIPFDALSQDTSTFAVMTLDDEDSTRIRAGDVNKDVQNTKDNT